MIWLPCFPQCFESSHFFLCFPLPWKDCLFRNAQQIPRRRQEFSKTNFSPLITFFLWGSFDSPSTPTVSATWAVPLSPRSWTAALSGEADKLLRNHGGFSWHPIHSPNLKRNLLPRLFGIRHLGTVAKHIKIHSNTTNAGEQSQAVDGAMAERAWVYQYKRLHMISRAPKQWSDHSRNLPHQSVYNILIKSQYCTDALR